MEKVSDHVGLIITARVNSKRIKEKVLQKIGNQTTIDILLDHVIPNDDYYKVVMAIPQNEEDDILQKIAEDRGIEVYRGQDKSPLHRLYECAKKYKFDHVVRVTTDDILIDQYLLRKQIYKHIMGDNDYTYLSRCPEGIGAEIFKYKPLQEIATENKGNIEFTSYYIKKKKYKVFEFFAPFEYQVPYRFTMDYEEDLLLLRILFAHLHHGFGTLSLLDYVKQHKYLLRINNLPKLTFYTCNYNYSKYVIDTIKSVIEQRFEDWEYIIIDDCSNDDSMNKIVEYLSKVDRPIRNKITIIRNETQKGLGFSSNLALEKARGKYICRVDSDDVIYNNFAEKMITEIESSNCHGVMSAFKEFGEELEVEVKENQWHPACCIIGTKEANEIKYREDLDYCDGHEFWEKFCETYKTKFLKEDVLWGYRQHKNQKTKQKDHPMRSDK